MKETSVENLKKIFEFFHLIGKLKTTYRFGANENCQGDSSADHSWRLALMTFMLAEELKLEVDLLQAVKIALVHDLAESITGDIDARLIKENIYTKKEKQDAELEAMKSFYDTLPHELGKEIYSLWLEYENAETREARYVKALDKFETIFHLLDLGHQNFDDTDLIATYANKAVASFPELSEIYALIKEEIKKEFEKGGISWKEEYDKE